jgi:hypothetical protein
MSELNTLAVTLVASVSVNMKTAAATTLFTVPVGKTFIPVMVIVRNPTASMAGGSSYDFTNWRESVDLSDLTTPVTSFMVLDGDNFYYTVCAAGSTFSITVTTGTTAACTATIDVFGYLF